MVLLAAGLFVCCGAGNAGRAVAGEQAPDTLRTDSPQLAPAVEKLADLFPGYAETRGHSEPFPYLAVHDSSGALLGYQAGSDFCGTTAEGYYGPVPVLVFADPMGVLLDFTVLPCGETPAYLQVVLQSNLPDRLREYRVGQEDSLDVVTMATVSSTALIRGVTGTLDRLVKQIIAAEPR
ncbi:FMN-binding protein [candidate division WOR-3 bacterium]|nr:FMN-binding protein [candidate division WOR-3 bacterium]